MNKIASSDIPCGFLRMTLTNCGFFVKDTSRLASIPTGKSVIPFSLESVDKFSITTGKIALLEVWTIVKVVWKCCTQHFIKIVQCPSSAGMRNINAWDN